MKSSKIILIILLFIAAVQTPAQLDEDSRWTYLEKREAVWFEPHIDKNDIQEIMLRWNNIRKEDHSNDIEGIYNAEGATHGSFFAVSEKHGFVELSINFCQASVHKARYGDVRIAGEKMTFYPKSKVRSGGMHGANSDNMPFEVVLAKWRGVDYLVDEDDVRLFCDGIAGADVPEADPYNFETRFFARGVPNGSVFDLPILPANYQPLIKKPIAGKVAAVGKRIIQKSSEDNVDQEKTYYESVTTLTLNIGSDDGVKEGMSLYVLVPNKCCIPDKVEITKVSKNSSTGTVTREVDDNPKALNKSKDTEYFRPLQIGQMVTSSGHIWSNYMYSLPKEN